MHRRILPAFGNGETGNGRATNRETGDVRDGFSRDVVAAGDRAARSGSRPVGRGRGDGRLGKLSVPKRNAGAARCPRPRPGRRDRRGAAFGNGRKREPIGDESPTTPCSAPVRTGCGGSVRPGPQISIRLGERGRPPPTPAFTRSCRLGTPGCGRLRRSRGRRGAGRSSRNRHQGTLGPPRLRQETERSGNRAATNRFSSDVPASFRLDVVVRRAGGTRSGIGGLGDPSAQGRRLHRFVSKRHGLTACRRPRSGGCGPGRSGCRRSPRSGSTDRDPRGGRSGSRRRGSRP